MTSADTHASRPIIIVGFMGSGKTNVARELARLLDRRAIDLDELISLREGRSAGQIIEEGGEEAFRRIETETLQRAMDEQSGGPFASIIALGGGAWIVRENRELIAQHKALTVWLDVPFAVCWQRIKAGNEVRPLAQSIELAERLYEERRPTYGLATVHVALAETLNPTAIAEYIAKTALQ